MIHPRPSTTPAIPDPRTAPAAHSTAIETRPDHLAQCAGDVWLARSLALAEAAHLTHQARWLTPHEGPLNDGEEFAVPSVSHAGIAHKVVYHQHTYVCDCPAGSYGRPCKHAGSVLTWTWQYREATRPQSDQERRREEAREDFWQMVEAGQW